MRLRLTRSIPGIARRGELKGNTRMDGAALDTSPAKVLRRNAHLEWFSMIL